jgi:6-hydroxytryprostatin B O-methyltransferase
MDHFNVHDLVPRNGSISFEELASAMKVHPEIVKRVFRLAFGMNLFKEEPRGHVAHTALTTALPMLSSWLKISYRRDVCDAFINWHKAMLLFDEPVNASAVPFKLVSDQGRSFFDILQEEDRMSTFTDAMKSTAAALALGHYVHGFDWASLGKGPVVDLGGGNGHVAIAVAKEYPKLQFIIQDLEANREHANKLLSAEVGLKDRIRFQVQDFFQPQVINTGAKVFFMPHIIHDWRDEDACRILKQLIPEIEKGAKIFICVYVRPTDLLPLPLLISAVSLVYKQNYARLNLGSPAAQFTPQ